MNGNICPTASSVASPPRSTPPRRASPPPSPRRGVQHQRQRQQLVGPLPGQRPGGGVARGAVPAQRTHVDEPRGLVAQRVRRQQRGLEITPSALAATTASGRASRRATGPRSRPTPSRRRQRPRTPPSGGPPTPPRPPSARPCAPAPRSRTTGTCGRARRGGSSPWSSRPRRSGRRGGPRSGRCGSSSRAWSGTS